jgi:hypothetical protein
VVPADLQHPWLAFGGRAEDAHEIVAGIPADLALVDRLQHVCRRSDFVEQLESAGRKRRGRDAASRVILFLIEIAEAQTHSRRDAYGKVRPANRRVAHERALEGFALFGAQRFFEALDRCHDGSHLAIACGRFGTGFVDRLRRARYSDQ